MASSCEYIRNKRRLFEVAEENNTQLILSFSNNDHYLTLLSTNKHIKFSKNAVNQLVQDKFELKEDHYLIADVLLPNGAWEKRVIISNSEDLPYNKTSSLYFIGSDLNLYNPDNSVLPLVLSRQYVKNVLSASSATSIIIVGTPPKKDLDYLSLFYSKIPSRIDGISIFCENSANVDFPFDNTVRSEITHIDNFDIPLLDLVKPSPMSLYIVYRDGNHGTEEYGELFDLCRRSVFLYGFFIFVDYTITRGDVSIFNNIFKKSFGCTNSNVFCFSSFSFTRPLFPQPEKKASDVNVNQMLELLSTETDVTSRDDIEKRIGNYYFSKNEIVKAIDHYEKIVNKKCPIYSNLGSFYLLVNEPSKAAYNCKEALKCGCDKCAESCHYDSTLKRCPSALKHLAELNFENDITAKCQDGLSLLQESADQGFPDSELLLADMYLRGRNVTEDRETAKKYYHRALKHGYLNYLLVISKYYYSSEFHYLLKHIVGANYYKAEDIIWMIDYFKNQHGLLKIDEINSKNVINWTTRLHLCGDKNATKELFIYYYEQGDIDQARSYLNSFKERASSDSEADMELIRKYDNLINLEEDDDDRYENTYDYEADAWEYMTEGQYGDYPGPGVDYDIFG